MAYRSPVHCVYLLNVLDLIWHHGPVTLDPTNLFDIIFAIQNTSGNFLFPLVSKQIWPIFSYQELRQNGGEPIAGICIGCFYNNILGPCLNIVITFMHIDWRHMLSFDVTRYHLTSHVIIWRRMLSFDATRYNLTLLRYHSTSHVYHLTSHLIWRQTLSFYAELYLTSHFIIWRRTSSFNVNINSNSRFWCFICLVLYSFMYNLGWCFWEKPITQHIGREAQLEAVSGASVYEFQVFEVDIFKRSFATTAPKYMPSQK